MSQKTLSAVVIIVVIGTVMAAGIYFFVAKRDYSAFASNQGDGAARTNESPPGNGWKVFRDSRYGFQFAYPAGWSVGSYHDRNIILLIELISYIACRKYARNTCMHEPIRLQISFLVHL